MKTLLIEVVAMIGGATLGFSYAGPSTAWPGETTHQPGVWPQRKKEK